LFAFFFVEGEGIGFAAIKIEHPTFVETMISTSRYRERD
jgi:hypothetical protein